MRAALGILALGLLLVGLVARGQMEDAVTGGCVRMGVMLGIWWFAYPQVQRVPRWLAITGGVMLILVVLRPKLVLLAIPILIVLWLLRPRTPGRRQAVRD